MNHSFRHSIALLFLVATASGAYAQVIPQTNWKLKYVDSQELVGEGGQPAINAFDGNSATLWHTQWLNASPPLPHEIQIDLGAVYSITGFRYLPRQDGDVNGTIKGYEFYVSQDGVNWGSAVATGTFARNTLEKTVSFTAKTGRYVRLRALSEINGNPWTSVAELNVLGTAQSVGVIPQTNWRLKYVDSEELVGEGGQPAVDAFDGNSTTMWHTDWANDDLPPPHEIQIDLGGVYAVSGFRYLPRQDGDVNGTIKGYEFYVSMDGTTWGSAVATGTFAISTAEKTVSFTAKTGRYVRLRALSEINGNPWTSVTELNVLGSCVKPSVALLTPWSLYLQPSTNLFVSANACLDPVQQNGWGVRLSLDGGTRSDDYTSPFAVTFTNASKAEHTVTAGVINNSGVQISGVNTNDQAVRVGVGDYYVAMGDSITQGTGDDFASDDVSNDGRNAGGSGYGRDATIGGGYPPILNNLLTAAKNYPQTVENEGRGGTTSSYGLSLLPAMLVKHPNAQRYLILYGMNDARPSLPVPSGKGLHPGNPGYPGTFKDNMQRIINSIKSAGKDAVLAKVPIALADCADPASCAPYPNPLTGKRSVLIQDYNVVVDELVSDPANNITVAPPDFFTYFKNHHAAEYSDNIHPNGTGYQSMANLWFQALTQ